MKDSISNIQLEALAATIKIIASPGKGILAADESIPTITKRLAAINVESTEDSRHTYRELLLSTPNLSEFVAGVILFEETLNQSSSQDGTPLPKLLEKQGILPGIKVDKGLVPLVNGLEGEQMTQGLDGLPDRLTDYKNKGAKFAKWRAVYHIGEQKPSRLAIETNASTLAHYAAICQSQGIVPIVEPEILIDGTYTIERSEVVSMDVLHALFNALYKQGVLLESIILKPSMVIPGKTCSQQAEPEQVAKATLRVFRRAVPAAVPTINFLSGGQTPEQATANLNAINQLNVSKPWLLSFSYARALQTPCLEAWQGKSENVSKAQTILYQRAKLNSIASLGQYSENDKPVTI